jgi:hypothetical protein
MIDVAYDKLPMIDIRAYKKHFENFLIKKLPNNIFIDYNYSQFNNDFWQNYYKS